MTDEKTPVVSEAPQRRRPQVWRTLQTPEGFRPSPRQQQRDARAYAEGWHQALRDWQRRTTGGLVVTHERTHSGTGHFMVPVVGNWPSAPAGGLRYPEVCTPIGWVSESALAVRCNADPYLSRVRGGAGLGSLIHGSGQGWNGAEARAYAAAVLQLAVALGDIQAGAYLQHLVET